MYNLLVTARKGAWDAGFYEYERGRFLEYTNENISTTFEKLTPKRIATLKSFPSLFAYEGTSEIARVGYLTAIKPRPGSVLIEFKLDDTIPPIPFQSIEPIAVLLDIRSWEMNRTHWAVKEEDLIKRLRAANLIKQKQRRRPAEKSIDQLLAEDAKPIEVKNVQSFIQKVFAEKNMLKTEIFFRGHSSKQKYKLEPSLFRRDAKGNYIYLNNEDVLYRELLVSNSIDFSSDEYTLDRLIRMQHYSLPTRLLDITSNPLIALYFACQATVGRKVDESGSDDEPGEVIIFTVPRDQVKYFDSDTASCIANLARLSKGEKDQIDVTTKDHAEFNETIAVKRLTHFIREEKPYFESKIVAADLGKIVCVKGKRSNNRISSQSGAFLLFGLNAILDEGGTSNVRVTRISVTNKLEILKELDVLNINESTVFPYIENSARYVAKRYAFQEVAGGDAANKEAPTKK